MKLISFIFAAVTVVGAAAGAQNHFGGRDHGPGHDDYDGRGSYQENEDGWGRGPGYGPGYGRGRRGGDWGRGPGGHRPPALPPPVRSNPCNGTIEGTWGFKGGRPMTLTLIHQGYEYVTVTVSQRNGGESLNGYCRINRDGSASVEFSGGSNNGSILIDYYGRVRGVVAGFSFVGQKY